jgi:hypothetical protein
MGRLWTLALGALAGALFAPLAAAADPLELRYLVLDKPFRKVNATTTLTLSLYRDSACTSLFEEFDVLAGGLPVVSALKSVRAKGAPKPLRVAELRFSLLVDAPPQNVFVRISGVGLEAPPGFECQAQVGGANAAWHWITAQEVILYSSPSLAGSAVSRLEGAPVGRFCVDPPDDVQLALTGVVASLQVTLPGYVVRANTINNNLCNVNGQGPVAVFVDQLSGGAFVPADAVYTLMIPGGPSVTPD